MKIISQRLIFQAERITNPPSNFILGNSRFSCADPTATHHGNGRFNIPIISTENRKSKITHIFSSICSNTSEISKQVSPIIEIGIYTLAENNLSLFNCFTEDELTSCNLTLNNNPLSLDNLNSTSFNESNYSKTPDNIIYFDAVNDPLSSENNELLFFPYRLTNNKPSILNNLNHLYSLAYDSNTEINTTIDIPSQTKYLAILPFVSIPIPASRFRISMGKISIAILLNIIMEND